MDNFILAQIVGLIALSLEIYRFQCKNPKIFFIIDPFLSILYITQFYLLGTNAYLISMITLTRGLAGVFLNQKQIVFVITMFHIPAYIFICAASGIGLENALLMLGALGSTFAFLERDNIWLIRRFYVFSNIFYMSFSMFSGAYAYGICCSIALSSVLVAIFRYEEKYQNILQQCLVLFNKKKPRIKRSFSLLMYGRC